MKLAIDDATVTDIWDAVNGKQRGILTLGMRVAPSYSVLEYLDPFGPLVLVHDCLEGLL